MNQPIFLQPVFQERIWGGTKLNELFQYEIPSNTTGECWAVSAHPNGQSVVNNGPYAGMKLGDLWSAHPELFASKSAVFPLLTKLLDASDDLSVQVHPDDAYAGVHENGELGKTECWYIVDAEPGASIIYGHEAHSKEQLVQLIQEGKWNDLLTSIPVKSGDFFYVPSGTIHALGRGVVVLETQQSSDTTYRVYDYDRRDKDGNLRELHLEKAIDVTTIPQAYVAGSYNTRQAEGLAVTTFVSNDFFTVEKWDVDGTAQLRGGEQKYKILSVIDGSGVLRADGQSYELPKGTHFILPVGFDSYELEGKLQLIVSNE
ncbi:mannose-6-phosphate isomerase, class I (plasmid) [Paenibacillus cellulosilyticus]|uniref:mannose-6-phosphate isomerase, class I n=1 Tax=Paenibacillus cellulosilyticus TaxID=375489 RepID=UPI000D714365|nr:mannose-6-phosphate isomerase, class I [Paenibacillus cellulosilyticus]QKS48774.1 mannose-6-phosphate isomerase, class I [Paenibacillus cellulosilyticus]